MFKQGQIDAINGNLHPNFTGCSEADIREWVRGWNSIIASIGGRRPS